MNMNMNMVVCTGCADFLELEQYAWSYEVTAGMNIANPELVRLC